MKKKIRKTTPKTRKAPARPRKRASKSVRPAVETRPPTLAELVTGRARGPGRIQRLPIPEHVRAILKADPTRGYVEEMLRAGLPVTEDVRAHLKGVKARLPRRAKRTPFGDWLFYDAAGHQVDGSWNVEEHRRRARQLAGVGGRQYAEDGNPLRAWRAYAECRVVGEPVPEWVLVYLDRVALNLYRLSAEEPPRDPAPAIAVALEMKKPGRSGQGSVFAGFQDGDSLSIALDYHREITSLRSYPGKMSSVFALVTKPYVAARHVAGRRRVSVATVRRAWSRHKHAITASPMAAADALLSPHIVPPIDYRLEDPP